MVASLEKIVTGTPLAGSVLLAAHFGSVALNARGYRALAYTFLAVFVLSGTTIDLRQLWNTRMSRVA